MRNRPSPAFIAKVLAALPADGAPISSRGVFLAIGEVSTPAYVRIVLRELTISGRIIGTGPSGQRVYRRLSMKQREVAHNYGQRPAPTAAPGGMNGPVHG
jgi:hypothetical protein